MHILLWTLSSFIHCSTTTGTGNKLLCTVPVIRMHVSSRPYIDSSLSLCVVLIIFIGVIQLNLRYQSWRVPKLALTWASCPSQQPMEIHRAMHARSQPTCWYLSQITLTSSEENQPPPPHHHISWDRVTSFEITLDHVESNGFQWVIVSSNEFSYWGSYWGKLVRWLVVSC